VLVPGTGCPARAGSEGVEPQPSVLETATPPWLEPKYSDAHDEVREVNRTRYEARTLRLTRASRRSSDPRVTVRVGTHTRRRAGVGPATCFRRCVCVP